MVRKNCWKRRNCSSLAISPFPTVFSKALYYRHVKTGACLGKGFFEPIYNLQYLEFGKHLLFGHQLKNLRIETCFKERGFASGRSICKQIAENIVGKGDNAGYLHFIFYFPTIYPKGSFLKVIKSQD